ncbi:MAG: butyrate kinase [Propionibacteriaceae bacterium]|nr:butyrate kinase [Propionibacteriaceae bacterium]
MTKKILSINPGSTSTKIALYEDEMEVFSESVTHSTQEIYQFDEIIDQFDFRMNAVTSVLTKRGVELNTLAAIAGRGGLLPGLLGGGYRVNAALIEALISDKVSPHASNLGAKIASEIAEPLGINAYIYDAPSANEFPEIAVITGIPEVRRQSMCHVLNMKAMSRKVAAERGENYESLRLLVAHLGGGITFSAIDGGKIVDSLSDDAGAYAPERSGSIPILAVVDMCFSGKYTKRELTAKIRGRGGLAAYFGTSDCREIEKMIEAGDAEAKLRYEGMAYQIAKGISLLAPVFSGQVDYVILTGGLAHSKMLTTWVSQRVGFIAPVVIAPGEDEMEALSLGVLRILRGEEAAREYAE